MPQEPSQFDVSSPRPISSYGGVASPSITRAIRTVVKAMLFVYVFSVLSLSLPLELKNPAWIQVIINALIQNAIIPLAGLAISFLLVILVPNERPNRFLARFISRFALPAALGFFLLIPLQFVLSIHVISQAGQAESRDLAAIKNRFEVARSQVSSAVDPSELASAASLLPEEVVKTLAPLPLQQLRPRLLEALDGSKRSFFINRQRQKRQIFWQIARETCRNFLSALLIGMAFLSARFKTIGMFLFGSPLPLSTPLINDTSAGNLSSSRM